MAEPMIIPFKLDCIDVDTSGINFKDAEKATTKALSGIKKAINDAFSGIDASAINKPIEQSMNAVKKTVQSAESAYSKYNEAMVKAGKSTEQYKSEVRNIRKEIAGWTKELSGAEEHYELTKEKLAKASEPSEVRHLTNLVDYDAKTIERIKGNIADLETQLKGIDPLEFIDKATPEYTERIVQALKQYLSIQGEVVKKTEDYNQTIADNRASDEYNELVKQAETYRKQLKDLNEKSKKMEFKGATDNQWENLRKETEWTSKLMDEVLKKMDKAVKSGKAFRFGEGPTGEFRNQINSFKMSQRNNTGAAIGRAQKNESPYTAEYQKSLDELDKLEKKIQAIQEKYAQMLAEGAPKEKFAGLVDEAEKLDVKIDEVKNHLMGMATEGTAFKFDNGNAEVEIEKVREKSNSLQSTLTGVATGAKKAQGGLTALGTTNPKLAAILGTVGKIAQGFGKVMQVAGKVGKVIITGFSGAVKVIRNVGSAIAKGIRSMNIFGKSGGKASTDMNTKFKKLTKNVMMFGLGFRTAYYMIKRLRTIFIDGFKQMGDQFDEFGNPMKTMMESFERLKGSLATAFQPLVSVVMPILTRFMNYLSTLLEGVGKFTATLTGQGYIYKAVAKDINSVSKSAKEANNQLGSYDKLEVIQKDNSGVEYEKETIGDSESAASNFAEMVKKAWEKADFGDVGRFVTEKLLDVLDTIETTFMPKITGFVNKLLTSVNTFFDGFDAKAIGDKFGSIINTLLTGLDWAQVGEFFANLYSEVWNFFEGLVSGIDWSLVGQSISTALVSFVNNIDFDSLAGLISNLIIGIATAIDEVDWTLIYDTLVTRISGLFAQVGMALINSDNPLLSAFGELLLSIGEVIATIMPVVKQLVAALGPILQAILPSISKLLPPIADILVKVTEMILPVIVALFEELTPIITELTAMLLPIILELLTSLQPIFDVIVNTVLPFIVRLLQTLMPLIQAILNLVIAILGPVMELIAPLIEIVFSILDPLLTILAPFIQVITTICNLLAAVLKPILQVLTPILKAVSSIFELLGPIIGILVWPLELIAELFQFIASLATGILVPAINIVTKIVEFLANAVKALADVFNVGFSEIRRIVKSVTNELKKPLNTFLGWVEILANGVIKMINSVVKAVNKLSFDVPDWVPGIGGRKFGFNLREVQEVKIPRLAQGAVIPPNKEFLAMLGDQKSGTNIEAPLDTIKQALAEVLAELGGVGNNQPIVLQVNGRTLAQVVWDEQQKRYKQTGKYSPA